MNDILSSSRDEFQSDKIDTLFRTFADIDNSDNVAQDIYSCLKQNGYFDDCSDFVNNAIYREYFTYVIKNAVILDKDDNGLNGIYKSGDQDVLLKYFEAKNNSKITRFNEFKNCAIQQIDKKMSELVGNFAGEYNILDIIDEDKFRKKIKELDFDENKIRKWIENYINES